MCDESQNNYQDPLYQAAVEHVREENRASISFIQRRLRIGYNRAATLMERMEKEGIVSPLKRDGVREVIKQKSN